MRAPQEITVVFKIPEGTVPHYVTNTVVQGTDNEHILSFFFASLPAVTDPEEIAKIKAVPSVFLTSVVMSTNQLLKLFDVLKGQLEAKGLLPK